MNKDRRLEQFQRESAAFSLRCTCEQCVHFEVEPTVCSLGYPTSEHRALALDDGSFVFCKTFEAT